MILAEECLGGKKRKKLCKQEVSSAQYYTLSLMTLTVCIHYSAQLNSNLCLRAGAKGGDEGWRESVYIRNSFKIVSLMHSEKEYDFHHLNSIICTVVLPFS